MPRESQDVPFFTARRAELNNRNGQHGHQCQHVDYGACDRCKYPLRPRPMPVAAGGKALTEEARRQELARLLKDIHKQDLATRSLLRSLASATV